MFHGDACDRIVSTPLPLSDSEVKRLLHAGEFTVDSGRRHPIRIPLAFIRHDQFRRDLGQGIGLEERKQFKPGLGLSHNRIIKAGRKTGSES